LALLQILRGEPPSNTASILVDILPGTQFRYSGGGMTIAQQAAVDATGRPFAELMRELILEPTGMKDSTFEQPLPAEKALALISTPRNLPHVVSIARQMNQRADPVFLATE
jgi:CubicO group peptidase (beta-lactamase class C family)